jgi:YidC/Oxa1 family membrane protein insertase
MKLNRTEWIMVILCSLGLSYVLFTQQPPPARPKTEVTTTPQATTSPAPGSPEAPAASPAANPPADAPGTPAPTEETTDITTPSAVYTFTTKGGGIRTVRILKGPYAGETEQILNDHGSPGAIGALATQPGQLETATYTVDSRTDRSITFRAEQNGLRITKEWSLSDKADTAKGLGYLWNLRISFTNTGGTATPPVPYAVFAGMLGKLHSNDWIMPAATWYADGDAVEQPATEFESASFLGLAQRRPERSVITNTLSNPVYGGVNNQYYAILVSPAKPAEGETALWASRHKSDFNDPGREPVKAWGVGAALGIGTVSLPSQGASFSWDGEIYTGPRSGTALNKLGGDRNQVMHYGWFRVLSRLFLGALNTFHKWVSNYGIAIMLLTLCVRIIIWPLHIKATRAMKRMSLLAPQMTEIREKYKADPQRMNAEVMKLYSEYRINPLGGCLPLLFQFPIFLGYYNMMKSAVEMRGHSFLWVKDLSMPDTIATIAGIPINPLPILMTVSMYIQMKVAPTPGMSDNPQMQMQQKIFKIMPFMFMFFCYNFASALALYWTVQNVISIFQTWLMKRQPDPVLVRQPRKPSFMEMAMAARQQQDARKGGSQPPRTGGSSGSAFRDRQRKN